MKAACRLFRPILPLIPRTAFERMIKVTGAEDRSKGLASWRRFVAMLFCPRGRAHQVREIEGGLRGCEDKLTHRGIEAPARSSRAYAPGIVGESCSRRAGRFEAVAAHAGGKKRFAFKHKRVRLDSTGIDLGLARSDGGKFRRPQGAVKRHLVLAPDGYLPCCGIQHRWHGGRR